MKVPEGPRHARAHGLGSIQCLRGVAATMVVIFHAVYQVTHVREPHGVVRAMEAGVDIFFVISGFIMLYSSHHSPGRGPARFLVNRLIRIAPLYWLLTSLVIAIALVAPHAMQSGRLDPGHALASYLFWPVRNPASGAYEPVLVPGWTLNYEMFFYVLFAVGLWLSRGSVDRLTAIVCAAILLLSALPLATQPSGVAAFYTAGIIVEFAYGLGVGWLFLRGARLPRIACLTLILLGIVVLAATAASDLTVPRQFAFGVPALLIFTGVAFIRYESRSALAAPAKALGDCSYSLYLLHPLCLSAMGQAWRRLGLQALPGAGPLFVTGSTLVCVIAAVLLYRWVEQPLVDGSQRLIRRGGAA